MAYIVHIFTFKFWSILEDSLILSDLQKCFAISIRKRILILAQTGQSKALLETVQRPNRRFLPYV